jgi:predicted ATP-grasp superfamily ATP-dependent carboligase
MFHGGLGVARSLGRLGVPVYGVHHDRRGAGTGSRYVRDVWQIDLDGAAAETVEALLERARGLDRPVLIATDDAGGMFVAENAEALTQGFRFVMPPVEVTRSLASKEQLARICAEHGVATPATSFPRSHAEVEAFAESAAFPVVLKGIKPWLLFERSGVRLAVAADARELLDWYDRLESPAEPNVFLQEYIPGGPDSVWMFNGYFEVGSNCLFGLTGRKLRQYPARGGVASLGICAPCPEVEQTIVGLMRALDYRGIVDAGFRFDARDGVYKLLDVNPRLGISFRLFVDSAGMDVVRAYYLDVTGQPVTVGEPCYGRRWQVENLDLSTAARHLWERELTVGGWLASVRHVDERAWFARDDLRPFARMVGGSLASGARRALRVGR